MDAEGIAASPSVIATYNEKRPGRRCRFDLCRDRIVLTGNRPLAGEFILPFQLVNLESVYGIMKGRSELAGPGALILGAMFGFLFVFGWFHGRPEFFPIGAVIDGAFTIACFITGARNFRKIESYTFNLRSGQIAFDIGRSGPQREHFDEFVAKLVEAIQTARA
jgi:hypothetical protein